MYENLKSPAPAAWEIEAMRGMGMTWGDIAREMGSTSTEVYESWCRWMGRRIK